MQFIYPFLISFMIVFFSELGDKTQLFVLSFSTKDRAKNILLGVALGSLFSHGIAILFGSKLGSFENGTIKFLLDFFCYFSFLFLGILGLIPKKEKEFVKKFSSKTSFLKKISNLAINSIWIIAFNIFAGEFGDKTFLASIGLGIQYPDFKFLLILGAVLGMIVSNSFALFFGKFLGNKFNPKLVELLSCLLFIIFGTIRNV